MKYDMGSKCLNTDHFWETTGYFKVTTLITLEYYALWNTHPFLFSS